MMKPDHNENPLKTLEIFVGESASKILQSRSAEFKRLIVMESDATYHAPQITGWRIRGMIQDALRPVVKSLGKCFPGFAAKIGDPLLRWIYPSTWFGGWTLRQEREWAWDDSMKLLNQSRFAAAIQNGRLIGVIGYKQGGRLADSREVFEMTKSCILPEYRRQGIYRCLRQAIIDLINERHGASPVMSFTRNPHVIKLCQSLNWRELSIEEYGEILERVGRKGVPDEFLSDFRRSWRGFLYDPQGNQT